MLYRGYGQSRSASAWCRCYPYADIESNCANAVREPRIYVGLPYFRVTGSDPIDADQYFDGRVEIHWRLAAASLRCN